MNTKLIKTARQNDNLAKIYLLHRNLIRAPAHTHRVESKLKKKYKEKVGGSTISLFAINIAEKSTSNFMLLQYY